MEELAYIDRKGVGKKGVGKKGVGEKGVGERNEVTISIAQN